MKNDIQEHYDSIQIKKAMQDLHITKASELKEYNCVTLANKLRTGYNKLMIIRKLNDLGYLPSAENAISIYDIPMSRKMRNIFLRKWHRIPCTAFCISKRRNIAVSQRR